MGAVQCDHNVTRKNCLLQKEEVMNRRDGKLMCVCVGGGRGGEGEDV